MVSGVMRADNWNNLVEMFFEQAGRLADQPLLHIKKNKQWASLSWGTVADQIARLSGALRAQGVGAGDRVVIVSENRPEWFIADLAIMATGAISVPAYITNTERDHLHILENSGAKAAFVSTVRLAKTFLPAAYQSPHCDLVIGFEPLRIGQSSGTRVLQMEDLITASLQTIAEARALATFKRSDPACIIYTSGTGGAPRGVRQHHGAILCNCAGAIDIIETDFPPSEKEIFLSFLPLSHAYEHSGGQFLPIALGGEIYYSEGLDKLASNIEDVRPTIMVVVPRLFEVLRQRISRNVEKEGGLKLRLFQMALALGGKRFKQGELGLLDGWLDKILERLVRSKVRQRLGGRIKALVSGGAPLNPDVGLFFIALGVTLLQGYGQTEAAPIISANRPRAKIKTHSVGPPLRGVECLIAEDGEICVRGELVMHGYWQNPEETARVLKDGWLHTGDIGHLDSDGHIVITDRKKDIIVNDKGDNVSPQRVEGMLTLEPEILQAMVYGDKRPHLVGLVVPDPEWLAQWSLTNGKSSELALVRNDPDLHVILMGAVDRVNARLSVVEKVRKITVAREPFSVENEQMTPTLKIRRHVIKSVYDDVLRGLYG
jgi:long-chain acyl-CoA synthetase